jgi:ATP sulfurylase
VLPPAVSGFEELQPVAERVLAVETAHTREVFIEANQSVRGAEPVSPGVQVTDQQARMRLAGRAEVLLHTKVQFDAVPAEPAAAAAASTGGLTSSCKPSTPP